jgi:methyl-accepting chemotaxis protein
VTQRNASAAEELASTAETLATQADSLQRLMAFFRLAGWQEGPAAGRAVRRPAANTGHPIPAAAFSTYPPPPSRTTGNGRGFHETDGDFTRF